MFIYIYVYGWLSKLWSFLGYPKYWVPYYNRDPKRTILLTTTHIYIYLYIYIYVQGLGLYPCVTSVSISCSVFFSIRISVVVISVVSNVLGGGDYTRGS